MDLNGFVNISTILVFFSLLLVSFSIASRNNNQEKKEDENLFLQGLGNLNISKESLGTTFLFWWFIKTTFAFFVLLYNA